VDVDDGKLQVSWLPLVRCLKERHIKISPEKYSLICRLPTGQPQK